MALNIAKLREELSKIAADVNIYAVARADFGLDVDENIDSVADVIEQCIAVEYENQFN